MNNLLTFEHDLFGILRVTAVDERPYFVGVDVERALRCYKSGELIGKWVHPEHKIILNLRTDKGFQGLTLISKEGVEALMAHIPVISTKMYRDWIVSKVLPVVYEVFYCAECYSDIENTSPLTLEYHEATIAIENIPNQTPKEFKASDNECNVFKNEEFGSIRTVVLNDIPYFVGKDVAEALGYSNTKDALATHVDEDDKTIIQKSENATFEIPNRGLTIINESGLYSLIFGSKLPTAKKFKRWVTSEVLPSIRKHGSYSITPNTENAKQTDLNTDTISQLVSVLQIEQEENKRLQQMVGDLINVIKTR